MPPFSRAFLPSSVDWTIEPAQEVLEWWKVRISIKRYGCDVLAFHGVKAAESLDEEHMTPRMIFMMDESSSTERRRRK